MKHTDKLHATITGVGAYFPDYKLTNDELSTMVDTSDEWIMTRVGIKERRILKEKGKGSSHLGAEAIKNLLKKTNTPASEIDMIVCATATPDMFFPSTSILISEMAGIKNIPCFDINAACCGFVYALITAAQFIETGKYKKIIVVGADKMSSITDYTNRQTCPLFGDAAAAVMLEPEISKFGLLDHIWGSNGIGKNYLYMKAGGSRFPASKETVDAHEHYIYQEGRSVFKYAVKLMADISVEIAKRNKLTADTITWLVPHQANLRIIDAVGKRMNLPKEKVMINIEKFGNTTTATIPLCLWEWEKQLKKGDNIILSAFGAGFTWASAYIKWAYNG